MVRFGAQLSMNEEIIVDNFAGGGGASTGIELACGRPVTIAINHDPDAILMHKTNHPYTEHYQASVWDVDPREVCRGRPVGLLWASPDCKHFSKAKGGKPVDKKIRGLAWIALRWAGTVRPRVIILENVEEFLQIGGRDVVFQVVPGQVGVDLRVETGGDGPLVKNLHFRPGGPGDDGLCLGFSMLGFPLDLRDRWGAVVWLCVGPLRAGHAFLCHMITSNIGCAGGTEIHRQLLVPGKEQKCK